MTQTTTEAPLELTDELLDSWANDRNGPVALHLKQKLLPVEGEGGVIFPPTYADIGYNVDTLSDGTKVATIDSVGSQANRMEPIFKSIGKDDKGQELNPLAKLVPQFEIELHTKGDGKEKHIERRSLLDLAHRSADAVVQSSPTLAALLNPAFLALRNRNDAGPLCTLAPTSLVFGVWDSRGGTGEKRPRIVRSIIRAWNVEPLYSAAQFSSVWKHLDESQQEALKAEEKLKSRAGRSDVGLADAPSTFRKVSESAARQMPEFRNGSPNLERRVLGGVIARGDIVREVTINLVALRAIGGSLNEKRKDEEIRRYLLSLALIAAAHDQDLFLREGCLLRYADSDQWRQVPRRGDLQPVDLSSEVALKSINDYASKQAKLFSTFWPESENLIHKFDLTAAKRLLAKSAAEEAPSR